MKKLLLCSIVGIFALTSCRKDDDATPSIVGVWKESKTLILSATDGKVIIEETPDACAEKNTYTFTSDGKYITKTFYTAPDKTCVEDGSETKTYVYDATTKKITTTHSSGATGHVYVKSNTATELQLSDNKEVRDYNGDGVKDEEITIYKK